MIRKMSYTMQDIKEFQSTVWQFYTINKRILPWRKAEPTGDFDPYKILVSEVMLQQTQVNRVVPKFENFVQSFPNFANLAMARQSDVLTSWSGLGYNRRAKFLWQTSQCIMAQYDGQLPGTATELIKFPGIGLNTANAILVYAFNQPRAFIETNIRTVYLKHFFPNNDVKISDADLLPIVQGSLNIQNPREWYWALMDYGSYLKAHEVNHGRRSMQYARQSPFEGSLRQVRGNVIRLLTERPLASTELAEAIADNRLPKVLEGLMNEKLIELDGDRFKLHTGW